MRVIVLPENAKSLNLFRRVRQPSTGLIKTSASLDREKMINFRIKAEYEQDRSLYAEADLTIYVDDVNDNAPNFESSSYSKVIPEDIYIGESKEHCVPIQAHTSTLCWRIEFQLL